VKAVAAILLTFFMVWQPLSATPAKASCCGGTVLLSASCCCAKVIPDAPKPSAPVPTRPATTQESVLPLLPTVAGEILLDRAPSNSSIPKAERSVSAGALPLFQRDCALLI
jgi:hypothetical protein